MKFIPLFKHIKILPEQITNTVKMVERADGTKVPIVMGDRSKDEKMKAVNKGKIVESSSDLPHCGKDSVIIYYPFTACKVIEDEIEYHVIHERDVMGYMDEVS